MVRGKPGFTLIELLIVVAIIGILAAIAVPNFLNAQVRAKLSRVQADLKNLSTALETYRVDHNTYPGGELWDGSYWWTRHTYRFHVLTTPVAYLGQVPLDPFQQRIPEGAGTIWDGGYVYDDTSRSGNTIQQYGSGYHYMIQSWGPDQDWEWGGGYAANRPYALSNGLISRGDIVYVGPGGAFF